MQNSVDTQNDYHFTVTPRSASEEYLISLILSALRNDGINISD